MKAGMKALYFAVAGALTLGAYVLFGGSVGWSEPAASWETEAASLASYPGASELVLRRVWAGEGVDDMGGPSPDGRLLSYTDWVTGNLAVRDLRTGEDRHLTKDGNVAGGSFALHSSFSPDGRRVVADWSLGLEVRVVDVESREELRFSFGEGSGWSQVYVTRAWCPEGREVVATAVDTSGTWHLALLDGESGELRSLRAFGRSSPGSVALSSDGQWIAHFLPIVGSENQRRLHLLSRDGMREVSTDLTAPGGSVVGWLPGGGPLFYLTDRGGLATLLAQELDGTRPLGPPRVVRRDLVNPGFMGAFEEGLLFSQRGELSRIRFYGLDEETGVLSPRGVALPGMPSERHGFPQWSADGERLSYVINTGGKGASLALRSWQTGEERRVPLPFSGAIAYGIDPDGGEFLVRSGSVAPGEHASYRVELLGGELGVVERIADLGAGCFYLSPGKGEVLCAPRADPEDTEAEGTVVARNLMTGHEEELATLPKQTDWLEASPVRREVAITHRIFGSWALSLLDLETGDISELWRGSEGGPMPRPSGWTPDGEKIQFLTQSSTGSALHLFDRTGRNHRMFALEAGLHPVGVAIHPSGRIVAIASMRTEMEIWAMENLKAEIGGG